MNKALKEKIIRSFSSVLPVTVIVLFISVFFVPMPVDTVMMFMSGAVLLIIGMGFFTLGADMAIKPMGEGIGIQLTKSSLLAVVIIISFVMGFIITVAEPDLQILIKQLPSLSPVELIITIASGVGVLLVAAVLRSLLKIRLSIMLIVCYVIIFVLSFIADEHYISIAFESGAIATGPVVVPFILAIGLGHATIRSDRDSLNDSFGMVALALTGPVIAILVLGLFHEPFGMDVNTAIPMDAATSRDVAKYFVMEMPHYITVVSLAMGCVVVCFIVFQLVSRRFHHHQFVRIMVGFLYTAIGLVFFLTGVNVGFIPVAMIIGSQLAASSINWVLIPLGALLGYFLVAAEPDVYILNKQVEEISEGSITPKMMYRGLAVAMSLAMAITMTRILLGIPIIWILLPGYTIALILTFFVPKIFSGIAFDSGAVCSGPISVTFLLPLALGVAEGTNMDMLSYGIGGIAIVALAPAIVIQIMGLIYQARTRQAAALTKAEAAYISAASAGEIIDWGGITVFKRAGK